MAAVLLADEHDERRAVDARGGQRGDAVAEAGVVCRIAIAGSPRPIA